jgi:hypothetical protein
MQECGLGVACVWLTAVYCLTWRAVLSSSTESVIAKTYMTKTVERTVVRSIADKREQITALRKELEDLNDYLDLIEARVRAEGKPHLTHAEVKKRYGLK